MHCSHLNLSITDSFAGKLNPSLFIDIKLKKRFVPNILRRHRRNKSAKIPIDNKSKVISKIDRRKQRLDASKLDLGVINKMNNLSLGVGNSETETGWTLDPSPMWYVGDIDHYLDVSKIETINSVTFHSPILKNTDNIYEKFMETESSESKNIALVDNVLLDTSGLELKVLGYLGESVDEFFMADNTIDDQSTQSDGFRDNSGPFEFELVDNVEENVKNTYLVIEIPNYHISDNWSLDTSKFEYKVIDNLEEFNRLLDSGDLKEFTEVEIGSFNGSI